MTKTHILKDKTVNLAYRMYSMNNILVPSCLVNEDISQILVLAHQSLILVTENKYFSSSSSMTK